MCCYLKACFVLCLIGMVDARSFDQIRDNHRNRNSGITDEDVTSLGEISRWAEAAYGWLSSQNCTNPVFTNERTCQVLSNLSKSSVRVYAAPSKLRKLRTVLPDGEGRHLGAHDGVLVLDPFPEAKFGHLVIMFLVDHGFNASQCRSKGGFLTGARSECLQLAVKTRCRNEIGERSIAKRRVTSGRRCEILFLPLVHYSDQLPRQADDQLSCYGDVKGFHSSCPQLRPLNATIDVTCDPLRTNTKRCDTTHHIRTRCHFMKSCDQAIILSGGWNRQLSDKDSLENVLGLHRTLRQNGFEDDNIKTFYANGASAYQDDSELTEDSKGNVNMYSSTLKSALRHHLRALCETSYCTETMVIILNSPTRPDGASLLWDIDSNGEYDEQEVYTVKELLRDVQSCSASRVVIVADQSFSGEIARNAARMQIADGKLSNVAVVASCQETQWSFSYEFSKHWMQANHRHMCLQQIQEAADHQVKSSTPTTYYGYSTNKNTAPLNVTVSGAPCNTLPPLSEEELQKKYQGCQNLSTWDLMKSRSNNM